MNSITRLNLSNTQNLKAHELASAFPMLPDDELQSLADDIKENGLNNSIVIKVIDDEDWLVDGRNRLAACRLANVEPTFIEWMGDIASFIYSENVSRRHLTISQSAIAEALLHPTGRKRGRKKPKTVTSNGIKKISASTMRQARHLVHKKTGAPDLVEQIKNGTLSVKAAHKELQDRQKKCASDAKTYKTLEDNAPDLAERVKSGESVRDMFYLYISRGIDEKNDMEFSLVGFDNAMQFMALLDVEHFKDNFVEAVHSKYLSRYLESLTRKDVLEEIKTWPDKIEEIINRLNKYKNITD